MPALKKQNNFWFVLGREPELSAAELAAVFGFDNLVWRAGEVIAGLRQETIDATTLIRQLGGTIKIAVELYSGLTEEELTEKMAENLKTVSGKIHFGVSFYGNSRPRFTENLGKQIKKRLREGGLSVRFVFNQEPILSSVTVEKNGLTKRGREFLLTERGGRFDLAQTLAVQPFEEYSARDYGRPGRDDKSGMLPPKLAIMMINFSRARQDAVLADPFCGSGTILTEAMLLGYKNLIGADISEKAIADTEKNLAWIAQKNNLIYPLPSIVLKTADIKNLSQSFAAGATDAVVTEPYLGKPLTGRETKEAILHQTEELKKIYLQAFAQFSKILKTGGTAVFIVPRFRFKREWLTADCRADIEKLGFTLDPLLPDKKFLLYARSDQHVGREIWRWKKIK